MAYRVLFPIAVTDDNKHQMYDIAIIPENLGVISSHWWHIVLSGYPTLEAGMKAGRQVLRTFQKNQPCPCSSDVLCRLTNLSNHIAAGAPK